MENAADALKMAGAVLLFVLAISIIILSFGQVRESVDTIVNYRDRETSYIDGDYYYKGTEKLARNVNLETIIPSIFRAYIEEYKIVFDGLSNPIYKIKNNGKEVDKYTIDLETKDGWDYNNVSLANSTDSKAEFIRGILYHDYNGNDKKAFENKFNVNIDGCESIYDQLKNKTNIIEYLGVYYKNDDPNVPDVNKTEKRIITYKIN